MITKFSNSPVSIHFISTLMVKSYSHKLNRFSYNHLQTFSNIKKDKKQQKEKGKHLTYNLDGINKDKLPEHLKTAFQLKKQTLNLQVVSQAQLQNDAIVSEIKRQRMEIETKPTSQELKKQKISQIQKFLLGLTGLNIGVYASLYFPFISNHMYWLGVYSSILLYPSLIFTTAISTGINLAYMILRQGLIMNERVQQIQKVDITSAPKTQYLEMLLISMQFFSLAISVSIPITLLRVGQDFRTVGLYSILFFLLLVNAHLTIQKTFFTNRLLHISYQTGCLILLFLLSGWTYLEYNISGKSQEGCKKFIQGCNKMKNVWRIKKFGIKKNQKITDIINFDEESGVQAQDGGKQK